MTKCMVRNGLALILAGVLAASSIGCGKSDKDVFEEPQDAGVTRVVRTTPPITIATPIPLETRVTAIWVEREQSEPTPMLHPKATPTPIPTPTKEELEERLGFSIGLYTRAGSPVVAHPTAFIGTRDPESESGAQYLITEKYGDGNTGVVQAQPYRIIAFPENVFLQYGHEGRGGRRQKKEYEFGIVAYHSDKKNEQKRWRSKDGNKKPIEMEVQTATQLFLYAITDDYLKASRDDMKKQWLKDPLRYWSPLRDAALGSPEFTIARVMLPAFNQPYQAKKPTKPTLPLMFF